MPEHTDTNNTMEDIRKMCELLADFMGKHVANLGGLKYVKFEREELQPFFDFTEQAVAQAKRDTLQEVENILPYGANFTDRFYTLKDKYLSPTTEKEEK